MWHRRHAPCRQTGRPRSCAASSSKPVVELGTERGGTAISCSPRTFSLVRLVTSAFTRRVALRSSVTSGAASITCSKLSRTRSTFRSRRCAASAERGGSSRDSPRSSTCEMAGITCAGSRTAARSMKATRSNSSSTACAASIARRVLPEPPGPVSVTRRAEDICRVMRSRLLLSPNEAGEVLGQVVGRRERPGGKECPILLGRSPAPATRRWAGGRRSPAGRSSGTG